MKLGSKIRGQNSLWYYVFIQDNDGRNIARVQGASFNESEKRAKAIIAANALNPTAVTRLVEAAQQALDEFGDDYQYESMRNLRAALAAMKKGL